jgi:hypothetical protein
MVPSDDRRSEGVDFEALAPALEEVSYPISSEALLDRFGDRELGRTNADPISLQELFDGMGEDTFESAKGVRTMVMSMMPRESVGPSNYSDRGGATPTETEAAADAGDQTSADVEGGPAVDRDAGSDGDHEQPTADTQE